MHPTQRAVSHPPATGYADAVITTAFAQTFICLICGKRSSAFNDLCAPVAADLAS